MIVVGFIDVLLQGKYVPQHVESTRIIGAPARRKSGDARSWTTDRICRPNQKNAENIGASEPLLALNAPLRGHHLGKTRKYPEKIFAIGIDQPLTT
jgi:hypothetical protein